MIRVMVGHPNRKFFETLRSHIKSHNLPIQIVEYAGNMRGVVALAPMARPDLLVISSDIQGFDVTSLREVYAETKARLIVIGSGDAPLEGATMVPDGGEGTIDAVLAAALPASPPPRPPIADQTPTRMTPPMPPMFDGNDIEHRVDSGAQTPVVSRPVADRPSAPTINEKGILVVWGPEGGVGRQTVALNLAMSLAFAGKRSVILVDLRRPHSTLRRHLSIPDKLAYRSLYTLVQNTRIGVRGSPEIEIPVIKDNILTFYKDSRDHDVKLSVLFGPLNEEQAFSQRMCDDKFIVPFVRDLLTFLKRQYEYVIVSLGTDILSDEIHYTAVHMVDRLLVVTTPHQPYLQVLKDRLDRVLIKQIGILPQNIDIIVNRWFPQHPVQPRRFEQSVGIKLAAILPEAATEMEQAVISSDPIMFKDDSSNPFVLAFRALVNRYCAIYDIPTDGALNLADESKGGGLRSILPFKRRK